MSKEYIAFDSHKHYTLAEREDMKSGKAKQTRIEHSRGAIRRFLGGARAGTVVAVEATGNWYWIVREIEEARCCPKLAHPRKAKLMMGMINKTDKLDVHGLNVLQRNGTLPTVWIAPAELRDLRELTRTRMVFAAQRVRLKNRLSATLSKHGLCVEGASDAFGKKVRRELEGLLGSLPEQTAFVSRLVLEQLDEVQKGVESIEERLKQTVRQTEEVKLLMTLPGVGLILASVMSLEIGDVSRFASGERLASYSGTTPRVHSSGGKTRYGKLRPDVNRYLKWAFLEAGNVVALNNKRWSDRHVSQLYGRLRKRKDHPKAIGAVARHLSESAWHVLSKKESYRDPDRSRAKEDASAVSS